jgi:aminoglycoside phosphotransferase (APT) family kinase protein
VTAPADARLIAWLSDTLQIEDPRPGATIAGGNANVTRLIETTGRRYVLRHPPADLVSDKAGAGIAREFTALQALHGKARVPRPVAWCDDASIVGQPFSLVEWVDGVSITDALPPGYPQEVGSINALGRELVTALAEVHAVEPAGLVPERFGRPEGFLVRQIERWRSVRAANGVRALPLIEEIGAWLADNVPAPARASLIHCDYHLDNCLSARAEPKIAAIIDWEMATVGDPRTDLGIVLFFWKRDPKVRLGFPAIQAFSNRPDAIDRDALAEMWCKAVGVDAPALRFFTAFAAWRLAAIVEGAYVLYREGRVDSTYAHGLEANVPNLLAEAAAIIDRRAH